MRAPLTLLTASPAPESPLERGPGDGPTGAATPSVGHSSRRPEAVAVLMILTGLALIAAGPLLTVPEAPSLRGTLSAEARP
ncbi:hypothetical protein [Methylobacterium oryzihabitans]|uniref:Uncharacterized protein n=1 Tax=Methylobacterium oryzihabitans TaxID=2499852 RepID=A0A3S2XHU8_9HYPH|nr:hypothetical protein [Methylobacterium oryzihabitans]RVU15221.1 hypothetical protein EOE48_20660 [Methylobacterium oryzihabitans]